MAFKEFLLGVFPHRWLNSKAPGVLRLFGGLGVVFDDLDNLVKQVRKEMRVATAEENIPVYEAEYGQPINPGLPLEVRRSNILAVMRERGGPITKPDLIDALESYGVLVTITCQRHIMFLCVSYDLLDELTAHDLINLAQAYYFAEKFTRAHVGKEWFVNFIDYVIHLSYRHSKRTSLELVSGTAMTGRWPRWNTLGQMKAGRVVSRAAGLTGTCIYPLAGVSVGSVARATVVPVEGYRRGFYAFPVAGPNAAGVIPTANTAGAMAQTTTKTRCMAITGACVFPRAGVSIGSVAGRRASVAGSIATGQCRMYLCGTIHAGEEAA